MAEDWKEQWTITEAPAKPTHAGAYWVGGINNGLCIHIRKRPTWLHRFMMRWAFGWEWEDVSVT